uniref:Uncharacterized protein n=1 Tax=Arundo donax TaxID=35708 RepID=A0A0A9G5R8_ARUDO
MLLIHLYTPLTVQDDDDDDDTSGGGVCSWSICTPNRFIISQPSMANSESFGK